MNWFSIFLTGLTTGGLSCLAMQGGLLASTLANQSSTNKPPHLQIPILSRFTNRFFSSHQSTTHLSITAFLIGKIISHTILGFFLGFLGSRLELSLTTRLFFQSLAALFMFATAMNLLEVHPIFRYLVITPPRQFSRLLRHSTHSQALFAPFILGFLTILIPCGVTQSMEMLAISTTNPLQGAAILFFFVLGTFPLFSLLGLGAAKLSQSGNRTLTYISAALLILLSLNSLNGLLSVIDSPITLQKISQSILDPAGVIYTSTTANQSSDQQDITITVSSSGYTPNRIQAKANIPIRLTLEAIDSYSCANEFVFQAFGIKTRLKPNDKKTFVFTPSQTDTFTFSCAMGMYTGQLKVI